MDCRGSYRRFLLYCRYDFTGRPGYIVEFEIPFDSLDKNDDFVHNAEEDNCNPDLGVITAVQPGDMLRFQSMITDNDEYDVNFPDV